MGSLSWHFAAYHIPHFILASNPLCFIHCLELEDHKLSANAIFQYHPAFYHAVEGHGYGLTVCPYFLSFLLSLKKIVGIFNVVQM